MFQLIGSQLTSHDLDNRLYGCPVGGQSVRGPPSGLLAPGATDNLARVKPKEIKGNAADKQLGTPVTS